MFFSIFARVAFAAKKAEVTSEKADEAGLKGLYDEDEDVLDTIHKMTPAQLTAIHKNMDADGDGSVTQTELEKYGNAMKRKVAESRLASVMTPLDKNKDGKLDLDEYMGDMMNKFVHPDSRAGHEEMKQKKMNGFTEIDLNKDGFVDKDELPIRYHHHTNELVDERLGVIAMKKKDGNGDGKLTATEFWSHMYGRGKAKVTDAQQKEFEEIDKDGSGFLELEEVKRYESGAHHTDIAMLELFEVVDKDKDHAISLDELVKANRHKIVNLQHGSQHFREWHTHGGEL